jgi:hypothetical protein
MVSDFCAEIRGEVLDPNGPRPPRFDDGRKAVEVLDAMRRSANSVPPGSPAVLGEEAVGPSDVAARQRDGERP